jgi:hypothetical protein
LEPRSAPSVINHLSTLRGRGRRGWGQQLEARRAKGKILIGRRKTRKANQRKREGKGSEILKRSVE